MAGSYCKNNHILQIIYYFCSIRHHRSHLAINPILFFFSFFFPWKSLSLQKEKVLTNKDGIVAVFCIIIIRGTIRSRWINRTPTCRLCWVCPLMKKKRQKFGAFHALFTELSTEDPQSFRILFKNGQGSIWELLVLFNSFISGLCLQKYTFTLDVIRYMTEKHIRHILK